MEQEQILTMISYAGAAKTKVMSAMEKAAKGDFQSAEKLIDEADNDLQISHQAQTNVVFKDCENGDISNSEINISALMVHAMDQVMNAMAMRDMAYEIINIIKELKGNG